MHRQQSSRGLTEEQKKKAQFERDRKLLIDAYDTDKNGDLGQEEIDQIVDDYNNKRLTDKRIIAILEVYDVDKDGTIDADEIQHFISQQEAFIDDVIDMLKEYIKQTAPLLLSCDPDFMAVSMREQENVDALSKFALNTDCSVLAVDLYESEVKFTSDIALKPKTANALEGMYFIKCRELPLISSRPMNGQLQIITTPTDSVEDLASVQIFFMTMHQATRHLYAPLARSAGMQGSTGDKEDEDDHVSVLQRRLRELDFALEQCQRGTAIPSIVLKNLSSVEDASSKSNAAALRNYLDKYNPSQVDLFFLELNLIEMTGEQEEFTKEMAKTAKSWPNEITRQTRLLDAPFPGSVEKEINFWHDLDKKLQDTKKQLDSEPSLLTKLILKRTNRIAEQLIHEAESNLDKSLKTVQVSLQFLRDFPIQELLFANTLVPKLSKCTAACLNHFNKLKHNAYDFTRAVRLLERVGTLVLSRVVDIMQTKSIMECSIEDLRSMKQQSDEVFHVWKTNFAQQRVNFKEVAKRKNEKAFTFKFDFESLQTRIAAIVEFREQHDKLLNILSMVLHSSDGGNFISDLSEAYQLVLRTNTDPFDVSTAGVTVWNTSLRNYEKRLEKIEDHITRILEDKLSMAKSAEEMFRVFSTFNPLFFRPAIRNAVNAFRATLVKNVREDVKRLQDKFRFRYDESHERVTADLRDIPPLSGRIIWARQIENQLSTLMKRIQDVLGTGWEEHLEGKQLKEVCDELRHYLDTNQIYEEWLTAQLKLDTKKYDKLKDFLLLVDEDQRTAVKSLKVNFDEKLVVVYKEVKYLEWLLPGMAVAHKTIPITIKTRCFEAYGRYPVAQALTSALSVLAQSKKKINAGNQLLLAAHIQAVRETVKEAIGGSKRSKWVKWDSKDLTEWVGQLSNKIYALQERVDDVTEKLSVVEQLIRKISTCAMQRELLEDYIEQIQVIADELPLRGLSHVSTWVNDLDKRLEGIIMERLKASVGCWVNAFMFEPEEKSGELTNPPPAPKQRKLKRTSSTDAKNERDLSNANPKGIEVVLSFEEANKVTFVNTTFEILLANQVLFISPPIEQARTHWINELHSFLAMVLTLPRVIASRYQVFAEASTGPKDYTNVMGTLDVDMLSRPMQAIETRVAAARAYAQSWLQYQALWDASATVLADRLGKDIPMWGQLLHEIKEARSTVDSEMEEKAFGPIVINHRQVQSKINLKYDTWQKDAQTRFGGILADDIKATHADVVAAKNRLENISLEGNTKDVILGVEFILKTKASIKAKEQAINDLKSSESLLKAQRFQFPSDWITVANVQSAFSDMCLVLDRRAASMEQQLPNLQQKMKEEGANVAARTEKFLEKWNSEKPEGGDMAPDVVLQQLANFTAEISKLKEENDRVRSAKEALGMDFVADDRLRFAEMEIADLREAWQMVGPVQENLNALRAESIKDLNPLKVKKTLEGLQDDLKALPTKLLSYSAVVGMQERLAKFLGQQLALRDVCTEALKERHWRTLVGKLNLKCPPNNVTVGDLWDANIMAHRKVIGEVLSTASGELGLEQFLKTMKETWVVSEVQLVPRDNLKIVTGWDIMFTALEDNLSSLASLKGSPYFKNVPEFQEDTAIWETRLTNLRGIFQIWVEVQKKWMYLRGIFKNADIKTQLPAQYAKFKSIDNEFMGLMKRVTAQPRVLDLLQIDNLLRQLERQEQTMTVIQKALGEYLEMQRQIFPRFYFVNNDDLVEIVGNSNEPAKIVVHLANMFQALSSVTMTGPIPAGSDAPGAGVLTEATHMASREGEKIPFDKTIDVTKGVKDWLADVESGMASTLVNLLQDSMTNVPGPSEKQALLKWVDKYPSQVTILAFQASWCANVEVAMVGNTNKLGELGSSIELRLRGLSECVLLDLEAPLRKKSEQLLTEMVHQRDVVRQLISSKVVDKNDFGWLYHLRFYWNVKEEKLMEKMSIKMSNASFFYGFEYLGIGERLVHTPLTDRCYITLTQALHFKMGGNPFGPAGTGKTESVKMLANQLGRFCLVFNCDASFDYAAMGRIFAGLCQVGAWGCFDEFNRLEERILSAVSQQILGIQRGLQLGQKTIEMLGVSCKLSTDIGIFVTMNPGYAGRSNLPDNLKQLFRAVSMSVPDKKLIAQVMLFSQGIVTAEALAGKIVLLFTLCKEQLSTQSHYDFGLRALKSVLVGAGSLKREAVLAASGAGSGEEKKEGSLEDMEAVELAVVIRSMCDSVVPKLVLEDFHLYVSLLQAVFPGSEIPVADETKLINQLKAICEEEGLEVGDMWMEKVLQLKQVLDVRHGVMMVGPSGTGKSTAWRVLLKALSKVDGSKGDAYVIDPKAIDTKQLYGNLDPNTLEWTDGVFTKILRKVSDSSVRGARRSWIIFDGDVDPEWAENLNSVLDDNKVLTLPSGDRLKIPPNVRVMMEVDSLKYATLATVSRAGMIWFADGTIPLEMVMKQYLNSLRRCKVPSLSASSFVDNSSSMLKSTQQQFVDAIAPFCAPAPGLVGVALDHAMNAIHIMEPTTTRLLAALYSMLLRGMALAVDHNETNEPPMDDAHLQSFATKWLMFSLLWSFGSSMNYKTRVALCDCIQANSSILLPDAPGGGGEKMKLIDCYANLYDGKWAAWSSLVPRMEIDSNKVLATDVVISTTDTVRHVEVLKCWLSDHKPLILCGPPGSGKSMTLTSVLDSSDEYILAALNFSSGTQPDLIHKTFAQFCEVIDSPEGLTLLPNRASYRESQWLVVFCDECNLPANDAYGTQTVITFLRQLTEQGGYWNEDCKWVTLKRIQFVGACNPPTDPGRELMSNRFLRHAPVLLVDYPAEESLKQIYRTFNHALLKLHPNLKGYVDPLNNAMVAFYLANSARFNADMAPQYIYSPRELSRFVRAMYEAMQPLDSMLPEDLLRLWAHEAMRLFQDRLIADEDKQWIEKLVNDIGQECFGMVDNHDQVLQRPILYSTWIQKIYQSTEREVLRNFVKARLKVFYEEELDVQLVVFDDVLDHVLRIDSVLSHPMGHLLLVGEAGVGKTVLTKFVAWMNGLSVFSIKANSKYSIEQFDDDLRLLFKRVGVDMEKICFIFDESNCLSSAFLERMNSLLASGEVPGLFEGDERTQLMSACRDAYSAKDGGGRITDSEDELQRRFTKLIQRNLHVCFTMNPATSEYSNRNTTSPALYNRCVVDWFGTWSQDALIQVGGEYTRHIDTGYTKFEPPKFPDEVLDNVMKVLRATMSAATEEGSEEIGGSDSESPANLSEAIVAALVSIHNSCRDITVKLGKATGRRHYISPRDFMDLIKKFVTTEQEKRENLQENQMHIRNGLNKLRETQEQVTALNEDMVVKGAQLKQADIDNNAKLILVVEKQSQAESRKTAAEELTKQLVVQNEEIRVRKASAEEELGEAEPTLRAAQEAVGNIDRKKLDEVRSLASPPKMVKLTMEMVCCMLADGSATVTDWAEIRKIMKGADFVPSVVAFDPKKLSAKKVAIVQDKYLADADMNYNTVNRASVACGPLYLWASAQIKFATILKKIKPLQDEVAALELQGAALEVSQKKAVAEVEELEATINEFRNAYSQSVAMTETVRNEMIIVNKKVDRARALLSSLQEERVRWEATSLSFDEQMLTNIGDNLLAASFLTYGGIFEQRVRRQLMRDWSDLLDSFGIPFRPDLNIVNHLSKPQDHLKWRDCGLPSDELAIQNAILIQRYNRFPLIIDPSGQATNFMLKMYAQNKIVTTSFLDAAFTKTLASSIRFGTPLLINDVESLDPILNPVLNREFQKTGGRLLINIGSEQIDFSPKFMMVLVSRNPLARFPPDLCSRVTVVNFTVTPASLEAQALGAILKAERPDVDSKRNAAIQLQGEQAAKVRDLQEQLLQVISSAEGAILDDDNVIKNLERIKNESAQIAEDAAKTTDVLEEVRVVTAKYANLASAMTIVYFSLEVLTDVNFLYQYSLNFFFEIVDKVLQPSGSATSKSGTGQVRNEVAEDSRRLKELSGNFFSEVSRRVLKGLRFDDKVMFSVRLALIASRGTAENELSEVEMDLLMKNTPPPNVTESGGASTATAANFMSALKPDVELDEKVAHNLLMLSYLPSMNGLLHSMSSEHTGEWVAFMSHAQPERNFPQSWLKPPSSGRGASSSAGAACRLALVAVLLCRVLRPERVIYALEDYISATFKEGFDWRANCQVDLKQTVEIDSKPTVMLMLCSEPGNDASGKVDSVAQAMGKNLLNVSMGTAEAEKEAEKQLALATKSGAWVLLRNVHLCPEWLARMEKGRHGVVPHADFRLFLTCDVHPKLPTSVLRASEVIVFESSTGIKANIKRFYANVPPQRADKNPVERSRLYQLLAWFNAVVQERLRYVPMGWTKRHEFSESDCSCALDVIDTWVDRVSGGRAHIDPKDLPWDALQVLLSQALFGGRVDQPYDQAALDSFIQSVFNAGSYAANAPLVRDSSNAILLSLPDNQSSSSFQEWVKTLPDSNPPSWIGLPNTAEGQLKIMKGKEALSNLAMMKGAVEDETATADDSDDSGGSKQSSGMHQVESWLSILPQQNSLPSISAEQTSDASAQPLERCLAREISLGHSILSLVVGDLNMMRDYYNGEVKITNAVRDLTSCFSKGTVPKAWKGAYASAAAEGSGSALGLWIDDLAQRAKALDRYIPIMNRVANSITDCHYWIGGMYAPDKFVTATRQQTAQMNKWSLEDLELFLSIDADHSDAVPHDNIVCDLIMEGAKWVTGGGPGGKGQMQLSDELMCKLPNCRLQWRQRSERQTPGAPQYISFPLYLTAQRNLLVTEVLVATNSSELPSNVWAQRGVAIIMQESS